MLRFPLIFAFSSVWLWPLPFPIPHFPFPFPFPIPRSSPAPTPTPGPSPSPSPAPGQSSPPVTELASIINAERSRRGLSTIAIELKLNCAATRHANDVGSRRSCSHTGSDGSSPWTRAAGCGGSATGEIIACGQGSPRAAVDAWIASPGHNRIMFDSGNRTFGLAMLNNYWVVIFNK